MIDASQKICPISGNTCNCAKGACAMREGVTYSSIQQELPDTSPEIDLPAVDKTLEAQSDALEAHSLKYHHCAQIFQLASGRFALFGAYASGERSPMGIPLLAIGTWIELEPHIIAYRKAADEHESQPRRKPAMAPTDYSNLFEDE